MTERPWLAAFLATSAAIGEPLEGALESTGGEGSRSALVVALRSSSRDARIHALARAIAPVVVAVDRVKLR